MGCGGGVLFKSNRMVLVDWSNCHGQRGTLTIKTFDHEKCTMSPVQSQLLLRFPLSIAIVWANNSSNWQLVNINCTPTMILWFIFDSYIGFKFAKRGPSHRKTGHRTGLAHGTRRKKGQRWNHVINGSPVVLLLSGHSIQSLVNNYRLQMFL